MKVTPKISFSQTGEEIELKCRASGEPFPVVQWLKNDEQIEFSDKIELLGDSVGIRLRNAGYSDTGSYFVFIRMSLIHSLRMVKVQ